MILLHRPLGEIRHLYHETFDPVDRWFSSNKIGVVCDLIQKARINRKIFEGGVKDDVMAFFR